MMTVNELVAPGRVGAATSIVSLGTAPTRRLGGRDQIAEERGGLELDSLPRTRPGGIDVQGASPWCAVRGPASATAATSAEPQPPSWEHPFSSVATIPRLARALGAESALVGRSKKSAAVSSARSSATPAEIWSARLLDLLGADRERDPVCEQLGVVAARLGQDHRDSSRRHGTGCRFTHAPRRCGATSIRTASPPDGRSSR